MWWDTSPLIGSDEDEIIEACLSVMEFCLYLPNIACQESALHGLGHLEYEDKWGDRCRKIIDTFLGSKAKNLDELEAYARAAYHGQIQ